MATALVSDFKFLSDKACESAEEFSTLYYNTYDKQRHLLQKLYTDMSSVIWNGNGYHGLTSINNLFINLPITSHELSTLDCQPISSVACPDRTSILLVCEGAVKYGNEKQRKYFTQKFILMDVNGNWKIANDCFRFID
ncbi:NTF2-related export protein 2 [Hydra vulgaris]|uniref:NTF2-related export protein n=1 Tax=Hydra vulgaris TaxID=6087 RepID=A0ABM4D0K5_HYDVU